MRLLLDTHAFIWAVADPVRLPTHVADAIADPSSDVLVSVVCAWEIAIKTALGRLEFRSVDAALLDRFAFRLHPVDLRHTALVGDLPHHHGDPFDRMLIAQAVADDLQMVTRDPAFGRYGIDVLW